LCAHQAFQELGRPLSLPLFERFVCLTSEHTKTSQWRETGARLLVGFMLKYTWSIRRSDSQTGPVMKHFVLIALATATTFSLTDSASACQVGNRPTAANFAKLVACVNAAEQQLKQAQTDLKAIKGASKTVVNRATDPPFLGNGSVDGFSGTYSTEDLKVAQCPPGTFVSAIQGFKAGSGGITLQTPISELRFACRGLQ